MRLKEFTELPKILKVVKRGKFKNRRMEKFKELESNEISKVAKYRNLFFLKWPILDSNKDKNFYYGKFLTSHIYAIIDLLLIEILI